MSDEDHVIKSTEDQLKTLVARWRNEATGLESMLKMMRARDAHGTEHETPMNREAYALIEGALMQLNRCAHEADSLICPF